MTVNDVYNRLAVTSRKVLDFYIDGFRSMTIGRSLWLLIIIKLVLLFLVLKLFFFPDVLKENYADDIQRAGAVREALSTH